MIEQEREWLQSYVRRKSVKNIFRHYIYVSVTGFDKRVLTAQIMNLISTCI